MTDSGLSEDQLGERFQAGDVAALCELFDRHEALLRQRIERALPPAVRRRVSASDILQESRLVAIDRRGDFIPGGEDAFRNWILGIVENKARRAVQWHLGVKMRSSSRETTRDGRVDTRHFVGRSSTPSQVAMAGELEEIALAAREALPEDYREILHLVREMGLPLYEAAERMGRSYEAVRQLYGRALARFFEVFTAMQGNPHDG